MKKNARKRRRQNDLAVQTVPDFPDFVPALPGVQSTEQFRLQQRQLGHPRICRYRHEKNPIRRDRERFCDSRDLVTDDLRPVIDCSCLIDSFLEPAPFKKRRECVGNRDRSLLVLSHAFGIAASDDLDTEPRSDGVGTEKNIFLFCLLLAGSW
jgi:hypothetical protein